VAFCSAPVEGQTVLAGVTKAYCLYLSSFVRSFFALSAETCMPGCFAPFTISKVKGGGKMKFMTLSVYPVEKAAEVAAAGDKVWASVPRERKAEGSYVLMSVPFDVPPNSLVAFTIGESDSAEVMAARVYPIMLAGATVNIIPLLEVPVAGGVKAEKKYRG